MKPHIGINEGAAGELAGMLNSLLADEYVLYTKTRNFHWNVVGRRFSALHELFEKQYEALNEAIDEVAERVRAIGGIPLGTLAEFIDATELKEHPRHLPDADTMISQLLQDHETVVRGLREDLEACYERFGDAITQNFLTDLAEKHEKMAWMLRAFLEERRYAERGESRHARETKK